MPESKKTSHPGRVAFLAAMVAIWGFSIIGRLGQLQIFRHEEFHELALKAHFITRSIRAPRGLLYDSHMDELATNVPISTVVAEPRRIKDVGATARDLAAILGLDAGELQRKMTDPSRQIFMVVKRRIDPKIEAHIEALDMPGIYLVGESLRVYPNRSLGSHAMGFVNWEGDGSAGIELQYDGILQGKPGQIRFDVDARGRSFRGKLEAPPVQGHSLVLSIDRSIQFLAESALAEGVQQARAANGVAIVMESISGRILALANYPDFNCNNYNEYAADIWRNRAISDLFEPGSTFKVVVATAALEAGLTRPGEVIDCQMGSVSIGNHVFHDHKPYGLLTFNEVLEKSSNVGAAKLGLRLGKEKLYEALRTFGFGSRTGVDLPGEIVGLMRDWQNWSSLSIGAISFGQEVGVTSMQMACAINAIASGGYLVRPSLVDRVIDEKGELVKVRTGKRTRIMRQETAAAIREAFEGVVLRGTGRQAALESYRAAGKTGTAQKIEHGRYSDTKYISSFIGFAPLPNPRLTILVQINEPKGAIYGGEVAAPIFRRIAEEALLQLRVPPDRALPLPEINPALASSSAGDYLPNATPIVPLVSITAPAGGDAQRREGISVRVGAKSVAVPDFHGLAKRKVIELSMELGIQVQPSGSGVAIFQIPPPGTKIPLGAVCQVTFARGAAANLPGVLAPEDADAASRLAGSFKRAEAGQR